MAWSDAARQAAAAARKARGKQQPNTHQVMKSQPGSHLGILSHEQARALYRRGGDIGGASYREAIYQRRMALLRSR